MPGLSDFCEEALILENGHHCYMLRQLCFLSKNIYFKITFIFNEKDKVYLGKIHIHNKNFRISYKNGADVKAQESYSCHVIMTVMNVSYQQSTTFE